MSIHQFIFENLDRPAHELAEQIGAGDVRGVVIRQEKMRKFLETNAWDEAAYKRWLQTNSALPTPFQQAIELTKAAAAHAKGGFREADDPDVAKRQLTCNACDYFINGERCAVCGCFMKVKARWVEQKCPIGKW